MSPFALAPGVDALARHFKRIAALAGLSFSLLIGGRRLLRWIGVQPHNFLEEIALSFSLGYGAFGTAILLLGLAGLWGKTILLSLFAAALAYALLDCWRCRGEIGEQLNQSLARPALLDQISIGALLCGWLYIARYALIPETFYDALQYHLALPNLYLLAGRIFPTPENSYSGIPSLPQMLNGWTLALDSWGITASLLHCSLVLWIAAALIGFCRRLGRPGAGSLAAAAFFLSPVVIGESFRVSVGLGWTLMQLCCFAALFAALTEVPGAAQRRGWLILSGLFLGFTMAMKYPAWLLPVAFLPSLVLKWHLETPPGGQKSLSRLSLRELAILLAVSAACLSPWVLKNIWFYRNPIYPFFNEWLNPKAAFVPDWRQISAAGTDIKTTLGSLNGFIHYALHPIRLLLPVDNVSESIGPFVLCFLPLVFIARKSEGERLLAWICLACWVPLSLLSDMSRFFIPHLTLVILLLSCIIVGARPGWSKTVGVVLACCLLAVQGIAWIITDPNRAKLAVFLGLKSYDEYLEHTVISYPTPPYAGIEYVNSAVSPNSPVMLFGDGRSFYLRRRALATSSDQTSFLELWANESSDPAALRRRFAAAGIDYIIVNLAEMSRQHLEPKTSPHGLMTVDAFWKRYTSRVFGVQNPRDRWVAVYKLLDETEAAKPHPFDDMFAPFVQRLAQKKG
jgi:hypothetical protein